LNLGPSALDASTIALSYRVGCYFDCSNLKSFKPESSINVRYLPLFQFLDPLLEILNVLIKVGRALVSGCLGMFIESNRFMTENKKSLLIPHF